MTENFLGAYSSRSGRSRGTAADAAAAAGELGNLPFVTLVAVGEDDGGVDIGAIGACVPRLGGPPRTPWGPSWPLPGAPRAD